MAEGPRVIVALPNVIESSAVCEWLVTNGHEPVRRAESRAAAAEMRARPFDLLIADATFVMRDGLVAASRERNPSTPVVVIGSGPGTALPDAVSRHAMLLDRPLDCDTLLCTVSMALLEGRPIRRSERKIANRFEAVVHGVPSVIIDASHHGVRLQLPGRNLSLPPQFNVRVPLIGVAVTVQRVWARSAPSDAAPVIWYGAALASNRPAVEQRWRGFVDMLPVVGASG